VIIVALGTIDIVNERFRAIVAQGLPALVAVRHALGTNETVLAANAHGQAGFVLVVVPAVAANVLLPAHATIAQAPNARIAKALVAGAHVLLKRIHAIAAGTLESIVSLVVESNFLFVLL